LQGFGITALYLNPVFTSASNHRYHTDDYYSVDPLLGGDAALRRLLDEAHARDMRVVLDGVFNHAGRGFWPFHHVLENGAQSPYREWFHLHDDVLAGRRSLAAFPSDEQLAAIEVMQAAASRRGQSSPAVLGYQAWWDKPALPKLDLDEPHMRAMILDVAEHWLRFGIDGWRLDVAEEVGADFWHEFRQRVRAVNPEAYLVAEIWQPKPDWLRGDMFDAFMNYPLLEAIVGFAAGPRLDASGDLPGDLREGLRPIEAPAFWQRVAGLSDLVDPGVTAVQLNLLGSHDTPRLRTMCGGDLAAVRLATLLQMTLPGAPCIYYGDEIGMEGGMDPGCRGAFPTDAADWEREPYGWTRDAIALRHGSRALRDGELTLLIAEGGALAYLRRDGSEMFAVVANAGEDPFSLELRLPVGVASAEIVLPGPDSVGGCAATLIDDADDQSLVVELPPRAGMVVHLAGRRPSARGSEMAGEPILAP
ncbi:MAG: alpha-amylase family glycosyl hydrolase, partial [Chloroflexota bacterium]